MGNINRGKQFEEQVRHGCEAVENTSVVRLIDPQNGYAGVRNICDFIVFHYPLQFFLECKSCYGNTLPFSNITKNQWDGLLRMSDIRGVRAGIIVWFIDHNETVFIPISVLQEMRDNGQKSVNVNTLDMSKCAVIPGTRRMILFDYDFNKFLGATL
jgi:recombination protein U